MHNIPRVSIPARCRTDHLYLLVGLNPLPNYVAARLLLKSGGKLHLVHSAPAADYRDRSTQATAVLLEEVLRKKFEILTGSSFPVEETDALNIESEIARDLQDIPSNESVGLHYTGGTKAMAVHAYHALQQSGRTVVPSYLDARTMELKVEAIGATPAVTIPLDLWPAQDAGSPPDLRDLMALHDEELLHPPQAQPVLAEWAAKLVEKCAATKEQAKQWRQWCTEVMQPLGASFAIGNEGWRREEELSQAKLAWPSDDDYPALGWVRYLLSGAFNLPQSARYLEIAAAKNGAEFDYHRQVCQWLNGMWLENYVLDSVRRVAEVAQLHDYGNGIIPRRSESKPPYDRKFEMDIAAMRSYRLYCISCTTSVEKAPSKHKLFEAILRGQQLGGDEACIGLVTLYPYPDRLRQELSTAWQAGSQLDVFGPRHLPALDSYLHDWFITGA